MSCRRCVRLIFRWPRGTQYRCTPVAPGFGAMRRRAGSIATAVLLMVCMLVVQSREAAMVHVRCAEHGQLVHVRTPGQSRRAGAGRYARRGVAEQRRRRERPRSLRADRREALRPARRDGAGGVDRSGDRSEHVAGSSFRTPRAPRSGSHRRTRLPRELAVRRASTVRRDPHARRLDAARAWSCPRARGSRVPARQEYLTCDVSRSVSSVC